MAKRKKSAKRAAPWKRPAPKNARHRRLTPRQKASAKAKARKAGRPYPNLIDNLRASAGAGRSPVRRKVATRAKRGKRAKRAKRAAKKAKRRDPGGGLTAAGRAWFARKDGAHLKPGVKKPVREMSPQELRRKGSWAVRFYGRKGTLPPLVDDDGEPTRFALTAAAWGEPVPKTLAAARRIAAKGRRLLQRYERSRSRHPG